MNSGPTIFYGPGIGGSSASVHITRKELKQIINKSFSVVSMTSKETNIIRTSEDRTQDENSDQNRFSGLPISEN